MLPLIIKRELRSLTVYSFIGFATLTYIMIITVVDTFNGDKSDYYKYFDRLSLFNLKGCMFTFPIFIFSFTTQINLLQCYQELEKPSLRRMHKVLAKQHFLCFTIFLFIGVFGYLSFPIEDPDSSFYIQRFDPVKNNEVLIVYRISDLGSSSTYTGHFRCSAI